MALDRLAIPFLLMAAASSAVRMPARENGGGGDGGVVLHVGRCAVCEHATIDAARDALRAIRHRSGATAAGGTVVVHEGTYAPLQLDPVQDSGASAAHPIVYRGHGADGEAAPVISAGIPVPASAWKPAAGMASGVLEASLLALGFTRADFGALPDNGGTIDACDQLTLQKMQLFHEDAIGSVGPHLARYGTGQGQGTTTAALQLHADNNLRLQCYGRPTYTPKNLSPYLADNT